MPKKAFLFRLSVRMPKKRIILAVLKLAALISFLLFCILLSFCGHMRVKFRPHWSWWMFCHRHVWIFPQGREALCYTLCCVAELQDSMFARLVVLVRLIGFTEVGKQSSVNVPAVFGWGAVKFYSKEPHWCYFRVPAVSVRVPALHLTFQGWLLCLPVASVTLFIWKFCLCAFGLHLETIFGSFQNVPEPPFTSAHVQDFSSSFATTDFHMYPKKESK